MQSTPRSTVVKVAIIAFAFAVCVGATAIHAWHARTAKSVAAEGMSIWDLHNNAHIDNLPVQAIENYN